MLVEALAWANVRQQRAKRAYLGDRLFVERNGAGPPMVFLAGLEGSTRYWPPDFAALSDRHGLLYIDALGFGRSPWPLTEPTLEDHLDWLRRTLVAEGATQHVTIVAHSFGTIVAAYYAARHPQEVERLVLLGTPIFRGQDDARQRIKSMSSLAGVFSLNPVIAREACLLMGAFRPLIRNVLPHLARDSRSEVVEDAVLHDWPSIHGAIQNVLLRSPIESALDRVRASITFVHGDEDPVTPLQRVREVAERLHADLVVVPGDHQTYAGPSRATVVRIIDQGR
ncbi:MAG: alpha/beta hydrolase [Thermoanaerobaculia bacterium]